MISERNSKAYLGWRLAWHVVLASAAGTLGAVAAQANEFNAHDLALLDRLTWGVSASSAEYLRSVGTEHWLQEQLHPPANTALPDAVKV
jgi:hypothetical protein